MSAPAWQLHLGDCAAPEGLAALATASVGALVTDPPAGIGFMGKEWDGDRGGRGAWVGWLAGIMRQCLRVLKPGAHGFVWALPRTSHWTATALEDAGFEVRDIVTHHFGTGFPKSLDVSKAIDGAAGAKREVVGKSARHGGGTNHVYGVGMGDGTVPAITAAKQWAGWGTALKPATEHWILVRKPLEGTVAANVQRHGTGALNIDGCRIEAGSDLKPVFSGAKGSSQATYGDGTVYGESDKYLSNVSPLGRWPANLILTHSPHCHGPEAPEACAPGCPVAELDAQSGVTADGVAVQRNGGGQRIFNHGDGLSRDDAGYGGHGTASRFFYCPKPARSERDEGLRDSRNAHPTVKPTELMEWLIRLITPPGATLLLLDPFTGSGTTGVAAMRLDHRFVGWEREPEYHRIAAKRIEAAAAQPHQLDLLARVTATEDTA